MTVNIQPMLKKGTVAQVRSGELTREMGHIVLPMCRYPRGLKKLLIDEYVKALAPIQELLDEFHAERERLDGNHNAAFLSCHYQQKFSIPHSGVEALQRLVELARDKDVFLVCQCDLDQRCHRELLLLCAKRWWHTPTELRKFSYPLFEARLTDVPGEFKAR